MKDLWMNSQQDNKINDELQVVVDDIISKIIDDCFDYHIEQTGKFAIYYSFLVSFSWFITDYVTGNANLMHVIWINAVLFFLYSKIEIRKRKKKKENLHNKHS
jgi:hypothetical protein